METDYVIKKKRKTIESNILPNTQISNQEEILSTNENNIILEISDKKAKEKIVVKQIIFVCFLTIFCSFIILFFLNNLKNDVKKIDERRNEVMNSYMNSNDSIKEKYKNDSVTEVDLTKLREMTKEMTKEDAKKNN